MSRKSVVLLYGLPCSGKSMVVKSLTDHTVITIDGLITRIINDPSIENFQRLAGKIVEEMIDTLQHLSSTQFVIEMGCLVPKQAIAQLEQGMLESGLVFSNVVLTAEDDVLIERIKRRNADIASGESDSIRVEGPDYLSRFKRLFDDNKPADFTMIDTSRLTQEQVQLAIHNDVISG